jgi:hypothetical protein
MSIDEAELEAIIKAAYRRGAHWAYENPTPDDRPYLNKAARDYADKTVGAYKGAGLEETPMLRTKNPLPSGVMKPDGSRA